MTASVRVRFAPSPTGRMHMGNVRAALLNYLFARQQGGTFILRIEDTDEQRNTDDGVDGILADLAWCGIVPDEGPGSSGDELYYQSHRQELYIQSLGWLIHAKRAYKCFCTQERLEQMRAAQRAVGLPPRYDGTCRALPELESNMMMAEGTHAFPSRTRPLSPPASMVLEPQGSGRVERCQAVPLVGIFFA